MAVALLGATTAHAQLTRGSDVVTHDAYPSCAGDGLPPPATLHAGGKVPYSAQLSVFLDGWGAAWTGRDIRMTDLDAVDGAGLYLAAARLAACGQVGTSAGAFSWSFGYEPYAFDEAGQPDARAWGRLTAAEVGFAPFRWLTLSVGVRRVLLTFGHDEPIQLLALPVRPYITTSVAPDRRLGLTLDDDFGVARVVLGVYEGNRDLTLTRTGGFLIAARLVAEPIGPVGNSVSTVFDPKFWRSRVRFAFNASILLQYAAGNTNYLLAADGIAKWGPIGLVGEYVYSSGTSVEAPVRVLPRPRVARSGLWFQAAAMLWRPWLEVSGRYEWDDDPYLAGQQFHALTAGATVYAVRQYLRVQALYTHKFHFDVEPGRPPIDDDLLLFAASLALEHAF